MLTGAEPDDRWRLLAEAVVTILTGLGARGWISLGAIPAAVPHTRPVPILGHRVRGRPPARRREPRARPGSCACPRRRCRCSRWRSSDAGIPAVGYFAQIPHYVQGPYALASVELMRAIERHLDVELPRGDLADEARQLRTRLDAATAADDTTRQYVERLESMVDESRLPAGDDLITEIERYLRDQSTGST